MALEAGTVILSFDTQEQWGSLTLTWKWHTLDPIPDLSVCTAWATTLSFPCPCIHSYMHTPWDLELHLQFHRNRHHTSYPRILPSTVIGSPYTYIVCWSELRVIILIWWERTIIEIHFTLLFLLKTGDISLSHQSFWPSGLKCSTLSQGSQQQIWNHNSNPSCHNQQRLKQSNDVIQLDRTKAAPGYQVFLEFGDNPLLHLITLKHQIRTHLQSTFIKIHLLGFFRRQPQSQVW